jgi:MoaA/NifB/PqqE/SkfB family radical SAM enzyme
MKVAADHHIRELPVLVILPHNRCNCRCLMCDIWKIRQAREITRKDLEPHLSSLRTLKVQWIVFSGGEPLMHSDLSSLGELLRQEGMRLTLLTAGLSLERHASNVASIFDDVIVSIDGPSEIHDRIRGISGAYRQLQRGTTAVRTHRSEMPIRGRCTIQKQNHEDLRNTVLAAHTLGLDSVSFLAADLTSSAFNRPEGWNPERQIEISLTSHEADDLEREIEALISEFEADFESGFIVEKPGKLRDIVRHFRSHLGQVEPRAPRCNAPWVSAVIEADGAVRPCFFHNAVGNIHETPLLGILNGDEALRFRQRLDVETNPICRNCVCSLFLQQAHHE